MKTHEYGTLHAIDLGHVVACCDRILAPRTKLQMKSGTFNQSHINKATNPNGYQPNDRVLLGAGIKVPQGRLTVDVRRLTLVALFKIPSLLFSKNKVSNFTNTVTKIECGALG